MKHLFLVNPQAGSEDCSPKIRQGAMGLCNRLGEPWDCVISEHPGHLTELARQAGESGEPTRLYACGGDGTLNEVINGAYGFSNLQVAVVPRGSGNDFVKQFSDPELFQEMKNYASAREYVIDLIRVNDRVAADICSVGFDARIGTAIDAYRRLPVLSGPRAYHASVIVNLIKGVSKPCRVELPDGTIREGKLSLVCVCNGSWYGGGYNPVPEASMLDGLLDVLVVKQVSRLGVARFIGTYRRGGYREMPELISHYRTNALKIVTPKPEPVNLDGELMHARELYIQILPKALRLAVPGDCRLENG